MLGVAGGGGSGGLVQGGTVPLERGDRSARLAEGARNAVGGERRSAGMGFNCRGALPRPSRAAGRDRRMERGQACRDRHARRDDRCCENGAARGGSPMNGVHDMGGMHGLGAVEIEKNEPVFHAEWEARTFALTLASGYLGKWNLDMSRYAREQMPGPDYLATSYYEHWLWGLRKLVVDHGLVTAKELESGRSKAKASEARVLRAADVAAALRSRRAARMEDDV